MHRYPHHITGLFGRRDCAETALSKLMHRGLHSDQLHISVSNHRLPTGALQINRESKINLMLQTVIGASIGFALGLLVAFVMLVSDAVPLFIFSAASPEMLVGWCTLAGAFLGCATGTATLWQPSQAEVKEGAMLVVRARNLDETAIAREVMQASADLYQEGQPEAPHHLLRT